MKLTKEDVERYDEINEFIKEVAIYYINLERVYIKGITVEKDLIVGCYDYSYDNGVQYEFPISCLFSDEWKVNIDKYKAKKEEELNQQVITGLEKIELDKEVEERKLYEILHKKYSVGELR